MERILEIDQEFFLFLNNLGSPAWDQFWNIITNKWSSIPFYALILYLLFRSISWKATVITLVLVAGMITCTDQLANVFKDTFERLRPCREEGIMEKARFVAVRCGSFGYFSAHAASSAALTVLMGLIFRPYYPKMAFLLIIWALIVGYSRIYVGVHYPLDVLTGFLIGSILGLIFYKLQQFLVKKYATSRP